jgi:hypothetical protein
MRKHPRTTVNRLFIPQFAYPNRERRTTLACSPWDSTQTLAREGPPHRFHRLPQRSRRNRFRAIAADLNKRTN